MKKVFLIFALFVGIYAFSQEREVWKNNAFNLRISYNYYGECQFVQFSDQSVWYDFQVLYIDNSNINSIVDAGFKAYLKDGKNNYYLLNCLFKSGYMKLSKVTIDSELVFLAGYYKEKGSWTFTKE